MIYPDERYKTTDADIPTIMLEVSWHQDVEQADGSYTYVKCTEEKECKILTVNFKAGTMRISYEYDVYPQRKNKKTGEWERYTKKASRAKDVSAKLFFDYFSVVRNDKVSST
jgi:hypothetical protein